MLILLISLLPVPVCAAELPATAAVETPIGDAWSDPRNPIVRLFGGARLELWSLQPVRIPHPPAVSQSSLVRTGVDPFLLARLEREGRTFNPPADLRTLARRAAFDLTGLPPTIERVEVLLKDDRPHAFELYVEELLASPRYGEHQARMWLDVVRYSDSNGFDWDEFRPQAWRFRDYVIAAFDADRPFDEFLIEQLAGDELLAGPPSTPREQQALIATGYLRLGPHDNAAALFNEQDRSRAELLADLVETTGSAFLGLTLGCCRCHDHKYDPLSQADHFRLQAFFEAVRPVDDLPLESATDQAERERFNTDFEDQIAELDCQIAVLAEMARHRLISEGVPEPTEDQVEQALNETEREERDALRSRREELKLRQRMPPTGLLMTDTVESVRQTRILFQGDHKSPRQVVVAGFPSVLDPEPARLTTPVNPATTGRRLTLARWIGSASNPLTPRVLVNRVWQSLFGQGLVATPNDFGLAGARPSNPELLDWLAAEFVRGGWSVKNLQRLIVHSAAYRQSAAATEVDLARDAANEHFGRQNLRRLSAEQLRDALLATSGRLTDKHGGPPIWPALPNEILQANPAFLDDNETKTKGWYTSPAVDQGARSIYLVQKRGMKVPFLEAFDLPENMLSCGRRNSSTVAPQALALLNSELAVEAARGLALRVRQTGSDEPQTAVRRVFRLALQREPAREELADCLEFLDERSLEELCRAVLNLNEFAYID